MKTHYEILGIERTATDAEIKQAFRNKAKVFHPDVSTAPDAHEQFVKIAEAYNILKDPKTRAEYDRYLAGGRFTSSGTKSQYGRPTYEDFERARRQARAEAEKYAVISLDELLNRVIGMALGASKAFFVGSQNKPDTSLFDYLKMGFIGFLLTFSIALSFTGVFTLPGIIGVFLVVSSLFKNRRFLGIVPFIISTAVFNLLIVLFLVILIIRLR